MMIYTGGKWVEAAGVVLPDGQVSAYPIDFHADFAAKPPEQVYAMINPAAASSVNDPILGSARKVMRIDANDDTTLDVGDPAGKVRCQGQAPFVFGPGHEVWLGISFLFPSSFPVVPAGGWMVMHEFHGPPFNGGSPNDFTVIPGDRLAYKDGFKEGWSTPLLRDTWIDLVLRVRFSNVPARGFAELWMNTGSGWVAQKFPNGSNRLNYASIGVSNSRGFTGSQPKHYRKRGMWAGTVTTYYADHRIGTNFDAVRPRTYG